MPENMSDDANAPASDHLADFEPLERELCTEGTCIGIIGPDGFCKECGRPGRATVIDPRTQGLLADEEVAGELEAAVLQGDLPPAPDDFADRSLCPDGACIGVIGSDGRCSECGRSASAAPG
jgi:hypothetical protein